MPHLGARSTQLRCTRTRGLWKVLWALQQDTSCKHFYPGSGCFLGLCLRPLKPQPSGILVSTPEAQSEESTVPSFAQCPEACPDCPPASLGILTSPGGEGRQAFLLGTLTCKTPKDFTVFCHNMTLP